MEISPMKAALIHADRQTNKHKEKRLLCNYANAYKNLLWQQKSKTHNATFRLHSVNGVKKQSLFCYLPI